MQILLIFNDNPFKVISVIKQFYMFGSNTDYIDALYNINKY